MMKSVLIGRPSKPSHSSSKSSLVPTAVISGHGQVDFSRVRDRKTIRLGPSNVEFGRLDILRSRKLNCPESINKHLIARFDGQQKRKFSLDTHCSGLAGPQTNQNSNIGATFDVVYRYSKPYTLLGVALSIVSCCLLAVRRLTDLTPSFFVGVLQAVIAGCLANSYVSGINQLSDIEIDKVNKPHLPLVSGELSVKTGILITSLYPVLGFCLGLSVNSWPLRLSLLFWFATGTAYSVNLPFLRWKRYPVMVVICSFLYPTVIMLLHLHAQTYIQGSPLLLSKHAIFVSGMMSMYMTVLFVFKDISDIEGDQLDGINSFASQFGTNRVFWICIWLLEMVYGVAILTGLSSTHFWIRSIMVIGHSILGFILWRNANLVNLKSNEAIESFYLYMWKLYYAQYFLVPFLRF